MFNFPIYVFSFWGESNKSNINSPATLIWSNEDYKSDNKFRHSKTKPNFEKHSHLQQLGVRWNFYYQSYNVFLYAWKTKENPPLNLNRQHFFFQNKLPLRARKMQISSDTLVVNPARLTFTLFWRKNFPSGLDDCFEYLECEILEEKFIVWSQNYDLSENCTHDSP